MQIHSKFFEEITISSEQIWHFPKGLPGFEEEKEFALLEIDGNPVFQVLQSINTKEIAFIVGNPYILVENYRFEIDDATVELLKINNEEEVMVLNILTLREPFDTSTINLQAPLIFNIKTNSGKQMIMNDSSFSLRHPIGIVEESKSREANKC